MLRHFCGAGILVLALGVVSAQDAVPPPKAEPPKGKAEAKAPKLGLLINDPKAFQGYTVLATQTSGITYLIDMQGKVVRKWEAKSNPALCAYLLENGNLLRPCSLNGEEMAFRGGPGAGGRVQEFTWDGELIWDFKLYNDKQLPHHDITKLPNGNVLMIVWDKKTSKEALAAGRRPELVGDSHLLPDSLIEIKPTGRTTGQVVWQWHLWDHLIQEHDKTKANYGKVAEHPELVNVNYGEDVIAPVLAQKGGADKLKSIGYVGSTTTAKRPPRVNADWTHFNCVAYNPDLDQIAVSVHSFSEFWIIDHSTTTAEAAGHSGGRSGKGGDLLYRWGNPRAYGAGTKADQRLFAQHNAHWIPRGLPGEGHLLVFNNGNGRPGGNHSSVDELALPADAEGRYDHKPGAAYGPGAPIWSYAAPKKSDFYSFFISGAQRLPNGNTLICSGANGTIFEVTPDKEVVWKYVNPVKGGPGPGGPGGPGGLGGPPLPGQILPSFIQGTLNLTADQKKQLEAFQKEASARLDKLLTDEQKKQFKDLRPGFGAGGSGSPPQPGQILSPSQQASLKLTPEAKKQLQDLQKEADAKLDKLLTADQKKQFKDMRAGPARGGPGGFGPGGPGGFGPGGGSALFRAYRYAPDYAGLVGKDLKPGKTIEELQPKQAKGK